MDDRTKAGLRGPVSVCRTDVTMFVRDCRGNTCDTEPKERTHWTITSYHLDGRMAQYDHHNPDGSEWISTYTYDATGQLQEIETRDATGSVSKSIYHYDQSGRLQRVIARAAGGAENTVQTFTYDDQHKTKTQHFRSTPERADSAMMYSIEGSDAAVSAPGATSMTTVYDDQDRAVETVFHDSQHRPVLRVTLRYDDEGRLGEESQTTEMEETFPPGMLTQLKPAQLETIKAAFGLGGGAHRWKRLHRYDAEGHRVETVTYLGTIGGERKTMAYNEHGDLSEEKSSRTFKQLSIDDQGRIVEASEASTSEAPSSEARFSCQYDAYGNWIERVISSCPQPDKPFAVCSVDRRSLTYYPA